MAKMAKPEHLHCIKMIPNNLLYHLLVFLCVDGSLKGRLVLNQVKRPIFDLLKRSYSATKTTPFIHTTLKYRSFFLNVVE